MNPDAARFCHWTKSTRRRLKSPARGICTGKYIQKRSFILGTGSAVRVVFLPRRTARSAFGHTNKRTFQRQPILYAIIMAKSTGLIKNVHPCCSSCSFPAPASAPAYSSPDSLSLAPAEVSLAALLSAPTFMRSSSSCTALSCPDRRGTPFVPSSTAVSLLFAILSPA